MISMLDSESGTDLINIGNHCESSKRKRVELSSGIKAYGTKSVQVKDAAAESAANSNGTLYEKARNLSHEELPERDSIEDEADKGVLRGVKRRKHNE